MRDAFDLDMGGAVRRRRRTPRAADGNLRDAAQLLRLPNRRDLYPNDGMRLRLADGTLLAPVGGARRRRGHGELPDRVIGDARAGFDRRVAVWAVTMTRDGIPSR